MLRVVRAHKAQSAWLSCITVALVALTTLAWQLVFDVIPVALAADARLAGMPSASGQYANGDTDALQALRRDIEAIAPEVDRVDRAAGLARRLAPSVAWMPLASYEINAWASQVEIAQDDLTLAVQVLDSSSRLLDLYRRTQTLLMAPGADLVLRQMKAEAASVEKALGDTLTEMAANRAATHPSGLMLRAPYLRRFPQRLHELHRELYAAASTGRNSAGLMVDMLDAAEALAPLVLDSSGQTPESSRLTTAGLRSSLESAALSLDSARGRVEALAALGSESRAGSVLAFRVQELQSSLPALSALNESALQVIDAIGPAIQVLEKPGGGLLRDGRLAEAMSLLAQRQGEIEKAAQRVEDAGVLLSSVPPGNSVLSPDIPLRVAEAVRQMADGLRLVSSLAPLGGELLGAKDERRYLVLGQSADELRATGGFVSSVWVVSFRQGALEAIDYYDAVRVDDWDRLVLYPTAPPGLEEHMNGWVWLLRDVSWDPDFPTTARVAQDLFRLGQRQDVDGVIAINQWSLLELVEAIGEVKSPDGGKPITPHNFLSTLEAGTDAHGRAYMDLALQGILDSLETRPSLPRLLRIASAFSETLRSRDTLLFFNDASAQTAVARIGWDGGIRDTGADYLYVVDSNVGWSKVDRNVERTTTYVLDLTEPDSPRATLTLGYRNHSGPDSTGCEPQWLTRGADYSQLKNACYWDYLRVYLPHEAKLLSSTPMPLPEYSVSVETGMGTPGQDTGAISASHGKLVFSGLITVGAGEYREVSLVYDLDSTILRRDGEGLIYELIIQKQPGVPGRACIVELAHPQGYALKASSIAPAFSDAHRSRFRLNLTEDVTLRVEFTKMPHG